MTYLLSYFAVCFTAAALLGFVLGWVLRGLTVRPPKRSPLVETPESADDAPATPAIEAHGVALADLPGMAAPLANKLAGAGVATVDDLWTRTAGGEQLHELAESLQLEDFVVKKWVNTADLMRVPDVSPPLADALIRIGVRSSAALAAENPDRVQNKLAAQNEKNKNLEEAPARAAVVALIDAAKDLV